MALILGLVLVPRQVVNFCFILGIQEDGYPLAEALDAIIEVIGKPSVRWQDASTTDVEAIAAAIEELVAGGGTEDFAILGAEAFEAADLAIEGFGSDDFGL